MNYIHHAMDEESVVESLNANKSFKYFGSDLGSALYSSHSLAQIKTQGSNIRTKRFPDSSFSTPWISVLKPGSA